MNKKKNTNKGITLIALIITVIVLLILAGTAISIAINGGDIFGKASQAREGWNSAVATEEQKINEVWNILNTMTGGNNGGGANPTPNPTAGWDMNKVASTVTGTITVDGNTNVPVTAPIPTGYTASDVAGENTIAGGLVIYQGTDQVSTDEDAITTRNQFVWIPVANINSMIMCKSNASGSICDIELANGELHCKTHNTTGATNMCGRLYGVNSDTSSSSAPYVYSTSMDFTLNTQTFADNSGYREPDLVTYYDKDDNATYFATAGMASGSQTAAAFKTQLQTDFYAMAKSVALYKGFYIARYEACYDANKYISQKGKTVMNASTTADGGVNMWYGLYNHLRTFVGDTNHPMGVLNSQMIWGCQYDQAIKFIKQNKGNTDLDPEIGHTTIGLKTSKDVSGATGVNDIMKNIYDLEGNCYEWTAQAYNTFDRVKRGGNYSVVGISYFFPASLRGSYYPTYTDDSDSSRSGLYL